MKEVVIRSLSGLLYISLLILSMFHPQALVLVFFVFGLICMAEFKKLIDYKSIFPFISFSIIYLTFGFWEFFMKTPDGLREATQILHVITMFVQLFMIKDLFTHKRIPLFISKRFIMTTFYLSSGFVFLILISKFHEEFNPFILLGCFILVWTNDTFAYLIGKNFGRQKLFEKISPKKTVEGFLGGLFFACVASYFIATFTYTFSFTRWLALAIIIAVFGTLGDLIESKFKRQAGVKDSGVIMPGHGGLLDRLDSMIFASPYIFLFLQLLKYVS